MQLIIVVFLTSVTFVKSRMGLATVQDGERYLSVLFYTLRASSWRLS